MNDALRIPLGMEPGITHPSKVPAAGRLCGGSRAAQCWESLENGSVQGAESLSKSEAIEGLGPRLGLEPQPFVLCPFVFHPFLLTTGSFCFSILGEELVWPWPAFLNFFISSMYFCKFKLSQLGESFRITKFLLYYIMFLPFERLAGIISVNLRKWYASLSLISLWYMLEHIKNISSTRAAWRWKVTLIWPLRTADSFRRNNVVSSLPCCQCQIP